MRLGAGGLIPNTANLAHLRVCVERGVRFEASVRFYELIRSLLVANNLTDPIENTSDHEENHLVISITYEFAVLFRMARHFLPAAVARLSCVKCAYYGVGSTFDTMA